jgi:hypothetical protein
MMSNSQPTPQQGGTNTPSQQPQQGTVPQPIFRDWASI